jgi:hypothetical protein
VKGCSNTASSPWFCILSFLSSLCLPVFYFCLSVSPPLLLCFLPHAFPLCLVFLIPPFFSFSLCSAGVFVMDNGSGC